MNRLKGLCVYLSGAIDCAPDMGKGWREDITPFLQDMNMRVLNPLQHAFEGADDLNSIVRPLMDKMLEEEDFDGFRNSMKQVMRFDLHSLDLSSCVIVNFDINTFMCGTIDEVMCSTRMHKPVLLKVGKGNRKKLPKWILGSIPPEFIFEEWDELKNYLTEINSNYDYKFSHHELKRFIFFSGEHMNKDYIYKKEDYSLVFDKWFESQNLPEENKKDFRNAFMCGLNFYKGM